jgi:DHA1 family bicyclomycin/chloramphenicol resistance-like MFS transporter
MKKNNGKLLLAFLFLLNTVLPLSTDLYLPALPQITAYYGVTEADTNMTLIMFFIPFSLSMLILGPLSDKYGRRPILIGSSLCYCAGSLLCAVAPGMPVLIAARALQAVGGGGAMMAGTAVIKDIYTGRKQQDTLAIIQSISMICPVVAPVIGAFILHFFSWRSTFWLLFVFGAVALAGSLIYRETLPKSLEGSVASALGRLGVVLRNARFNMLIVIFAVTSFAFMAFLATASYIYQEYFNTSELVFSYYYAVVAVGMVIGPLIYVFLSRKVRNLFLVIAVSLAIAIVCCVMLMVFGHTSPLVFTLLVFPLCFVSDFVRPAGPYLMLNLYKHDTGTISSLIGAANFLTGAIGMSVAMLFNDFIIAVGLLFLLCNLPALTLWLGFFRNANRHLLAPEDPH